jgi:hypothetical protein
MAPGQVDGSSSRACINATTPVNACFRRAQVLWNAPPTLPPQELSHLVGIDLDPLAHRLAGDRLARQREALSRDSPDVHLLHGNYRCGSPCRARPCRDAAHAEGRREAPLPSCYQWVLVPPHSNLEEHAPWRMPDAVSAAFTLQPPPPANWQSVPCGPFQPGAAAAAGAAVRFSCGAGGRHAHGPGGVIYAGGATQVHAWARWVRG